RWRVCIAADEDPSASGSVEEEVVLRVPGAAFRGANVVSFERGPLRLDESQIGRSPIAAGAVAQGRGHFVGERSGVHQSFERRSPSDFRAKGNAGMLGE